MKMVKSSLIIWLVFASCIAYGYETRTHAELSKKALLNSDVKLYPRILEELGYQGDSLHDSNFTYSNGETDDYDGIPSNINRTLLDLVHDGAILEDVTDFEIRGANHFFDVQNNIRLPQTAQNNYRSPDWILEDRLINEESAFYELPRLGLGVTQNFSFFDAVDYLHNSLALPSKEDREEQFALTFRSIGQVVHHIQDMGQPQHARADDHCHSGGGGVLAWIFNNGISKVICENGHEPSLYEAYSGKVTDKLVSVEYDYPVPDFSSARDFFETNVGSTSSQGEGIAEFTGFNFITEGTNFIYNSDGSSQAWHFTNPDLNPPDRTLEFPRVPSLCNSVNIQNIGANSYGEVPPEQLYGVVRFCETYVTDALNSVRSKPNERATTFSIFSDDLINHAQPDSLQTFESYSYNTYNMDSAHEFLIPRAISYSTGLINYFFRSRFEIVSKSIAGSTVTIELKNISGNGDNEYDFKSDDSLFQVFYDDVDDNRFPISTALTIDGVPLTSDEMDGKWLMATDWLHGETKTIEVTPPAEWDITKPLTVVFKGLTSLTDDPDGDIEIGVAGIVVEDPDTSLQVRVGSQSYKLNYSNDVWEATETASDGTMEIMNVNWRGRYVNGKPTLHLAWSGNNGRYFHSPDLADVGNISSLPPTRLRNVYKNGKSFAIAPVSVLGAAIQEIQGADYLYVIGVDDNIYRTLADDTLDVATRVWTLMGALEMSTVTSDPKWRNDWFFNGDGTAAVSVQHGDDYGDFRPAHRFMFNVVDTSMSLNIFPLQVAPPSSLDDRYNFTKTGEGVFAMDYKDDVLVEAHARISISRSGSRAFVQEESVFEYEIAGSSYNYYEQAMSSTFRPLNDPSDNYEWVSSTFTKSSSTGIYYMDLRYDLSIGVKFEKDVPHTSGSPTVGTSAAIFIRQGSSHEEVEFSTTDETYGFTAHRSSRRMDRKTEYVNIALLRDAPSINRYSSISAATSINGDSVISIRTSRFNNTMTLLTGGSNALEVLNSESFNVGTLR